MKNLIAIKNLTISYGTKTVVKDISFNVSDGDFLVIFGENGSGKSSLLNALLKLKETTSGEIIFDDSLKNSRIGYLPQTMSLKKDFPASVREVVLSGCLNSMGLRPFYKKAEKETAKQNMQLLSVYDLKDERFSNLSGGQRQRVLLARALCATDKLLVLDEPVQGLDAASTIDFYEAVQKINERGVTIIMVSHDTHSSLGVAKNVLEIKNHQISYFGSVIDYI